jgi:hypothetical protein
LNNNRNNNNNNRRRGRGNNNRQQGGQQLNRIDSRARGNAPQMLEKYRKLAHDSHLNGDRVTEEYYLQFADHYFRVIADQRVRQDEQRQPRPNESGAGYGDDYAEDDYYADANSPYDRAGNYAPSTPGNGQANQGQGSQAGQNGGNGNYQNGNQQNGSSQNGNAQNGNAQNGNSQGGNAQGNAVANGSGNERGQGGERSQGGERAERGRRGDRNERGERNDRGEQRPERNEQRAERTPRSEAAEPQPVDAQPSEQPEVQQDAGERTVYEPTENPFVRTDRAPRTPRARKPRREDAGEGTAARTADTAEIGAREEPAPLDPASLPPAISRREELAEDAPAKPKRRTRRAAPPSDDAGALPETVN